MNKIELIDRVAMIADLKTQFAAVYKNTILRPIMDDDPFVEVVAKSEGQHMRRFLDWLEAYLMTRPTIDAAPVRRGEWKDVTDPLVDEMPSYECAVCGEVGSWRPTPFCPNCGADMRGEAE